MSVTRGSGAARAITVLVSLFAATVIGLAVVGGVRSFSPVPHWDQWNAMLGFFMKAQDGDASVWWAQHNEHRILLSRLLFWAELEWFGGLGRFLTVVNYLLVAAIAGLTWRFVRILAGTPRPAPEEVWLGLFVAAWLFSWAQSDNLRWAFQSQFFLAQLMPLASFFLLQRALQRPESRGPFAAACATGLLSIGTMANGVLVLPLMVLQALWTRVRLARVGVLVALSALELALYFHGYHATVKESFPPWEHPAAMLRYVLLYLGNPFHALAGGGAAGRLVALVAGAVLLLAFGHLGLRHLRREHRAGLPLALLVFVLYVIGSAVAAGNGRLAVGATQSLTGRYATPGLMAWAVVFLLYAPLGARSARRGARLAFGGVLTVVGVATLLYQTRAVEDVSEDNFQRRLAVLALELQVRDEARIRKVYPDVSAVLEIAREASSRRLSVFGAAPFAGMSERLGARAEVGAEPAGEGRLEGHLPIEGEPRFDLVRGFLQGPGAVVPEAVWLLDEERTIVGYAITGRPRADVGKVGGPTARLAGFAGYLRRERAGSSVWVVGRGPECRVAEAFPVGGAGSDSGERR